MRSRSAVDEKGAPEKETEGPEPKTGVSTELMFTGISVLAALLGFGLAWQLYYRRTDLPDKIAASMAGAYQTLVHKYYVDELVRRGFCEAADQFFDANSVAWGGSGRLSMRR